VDGGVRAVEAPAINPLDVVVGFKWVWRWCPSGQSARKLERPKAEERVPALAADVAGAGPQQVGQLRAGQVRSEGRDPGAPPATSGAEKLVPDTAM
jgi:hypothetical protein